MTPATKQTIRRRGFMHLPSDHQAGNNQESPFYGAAFCLFISIEVTVLRSRLYIYMCGKFDFKVDHNNGQKDKVSAAGSWPTAPRASKVHESLAEERHQTEAQGFRCSLVCSFQVAVHTLQSILLC